MAVPANPGWKFGYVPTPGEWANWWSKKVDYPAPPEQGGTGGLTAASGNYNLQQRAEVTQSPLAANALTVYSLRTDQLAIVVDLPPITDVTPGDWIVLADTGFNAAANTVSVQAAGADEIYFAGTPASTLSLNKSGTQCLLVASKSGWRAEITGQGTGIGLAMAGIRTITQSVTIDESYVGYLCKVSGAGVTITLPTQGFISGNAVAFDNVDPANSVTFVSTGDAAPVLAPGDSMIVAADGAGSWWTAAHYVSAPIPRQPIPEQNEGVAYELQVTDAGQYVQFTANAPITVTVPANADINIPIGSVIVFEQLGTGQITLVGANGVTLNGKNGLRSGGQFGVFQIKSGSGGSADTWTVLGDTSV